MNRRRIARTTLGLAAVVSVIAPATPAVAKPATYEVVWRDGGASGPYALHAFEGGTLGSGLFAVGYTGGAAAVNRTGVVWRSAEGNTQVAGTASGDLNGDGQDDVVLGTYENNRVIVLDGVDGSGLGSRSFPDAPGGLAVADATGDGSFEIYVVVRGLSGSATTVSLLDGETLEPLWSSSLGASLGAGFGIDAGDLTGDGRADVVFGTTGGTRTFAFDADGEKLWEADLGGTVQRLEVAGDTVFAARGGATLAALRAGDGTQRWTHPGLGGFGVISVDDLNGNGAPDVAWAQYGASGKSAQYQVTAVDGVTGLPMWTQPTLTPAKAVATGDVTGDGRPEVVVSTQDVGPGVEGPNFVWTYDGASGRTLWSHPVAGERTTYLSDIALADVAGDSRREVVVAPYFEVLLGLDGADGARVWTAPLGAWVSDATAADLTGDGAPEVVTGSDDFRVTARDAAGGEVLWTRDLGAQILRVSTVPAGSGHDVLAISLSTLYRLRGADGTVRWSHPLAGMGTAVQLVEQPAGPPLVAVGARARRTPRGPGGDIIGGVLSVLDGQTGQLRWSIPTPTAPWHLTSADLDGDGFENLVVGTPPAIAGVGATLMVLDGAGLGTLPLPVWRTEPDGTIVGLSVADGNVITVRQGVNAVVAQDGATGDERWRRAFGATIRPIGIEDVNDDGTPDVLLATETFSTHVAAVDGRTGGLLFHLDAGLMFIKAAAWADVSGDEVPDLLYASDGGVYGNGGLFAMDGATLGDASPKVLWSHPDVNARGLFPVLVEDEELWLAFGVSIRPDIIAMIRPIPEEPDEDEG